VYSNHNRDCSVYTMKLAEDKHDKVFTHSHTTLTRLEMSDKARYLLLRSRLARIHGSVFSLFALNLLVDEIR